VAPSSASRASMRRRCRRSPHSRSRPAKHGVLQIRQRGARRPARIGQADRVVRRVAFALGADHDVQQALGGQFAGRVGIGADQPYRQPVGPACRARCSAARLALPVWLPYSTVRRWPGRVGGGGRCGHGCGGMSPRQSGGMAGQPPQPGGIQPVDEPRKPGLAVFAQGDGVENAGAALMAEPCWAGPMLGTCRHRQKGWPVIGLCLRLISDARARAEILGGLPGSGALRARLPAPACPAPIR
jgi:hypothetical protein